MDKMDICSIFFNAVDFKLHSSFKAKLYVVLALGGKPE